MFKCLHFLQIVRINAYLCSLNAIPLKRKIWKL